MCLMKTARQRLKMSQQELAMITGLTAASISRYETGTRHLPVEKAKIIAAALQINWTEFYNDTDTPSEQEEKNG